MFPTRLQHKNTRLKNCRKLGCKIAQFVALEVSFPMRLLLVCSGTSHRATNTLHDENLYRRHLSYRNTNTILGISSLAPIPIKLINNQVRIVWEFLKTTIVPKQINVGQFPTMNTIIKLKTVVPQAAHLGQSPSLCPDHDHRPCPRPCWACRGYCPCWGVPGHYPC